MTAADRCQVSASQVEDIYPCTPLQEGLVALAIKKPGKYIATFEYEIAADICLDQFQTAWNATVTANPILRTRIVPFDSGTFQVVVGKSIVWNFYDTEVSYTKLVKTLTMDMGEELVHFGVIKSEANPRKGFKFHLTLHHALYDGSSLSLLWSQVHKAYHKEPLLTRPFNRFIEHILPTKSNEDFWRSEFADLSAPVFPVLQSPLFIPSPTSSLSHVISDFNHTMTNYTTSTLIRMAWAIIMSSYTDSEDVVYGLTVNGRSAPLPGIEDLTGPTFATFPVRVHVRPGDSVGAALSLVQQKAIDMIPFQHCGLQNIRQFNENTAAACSFQCHLAIQAPARFGDAGIFSSVQSKHEDYGAFANYAFVIICHLPERSQPNDIIVSVSYDERVVQPLEATRMVQ